MENIGITEFALVFILPVCFLLLHILAFIDIFRYNFKKYDKTMFILFVTFVPIIGPILYFMIGPDRRIEKE
jgi:hypothetical protein